MGAGISRRIAGVARLVTRFPGAVAAGFAGASVAFLVLGAETLAVLAFMGAFVFGVLAWRDEWGPLSDG